MRQSVYTVCVCVCVVFLLGEPPKIEGRSCCGRPSDVSEEIVRVCE